MTEKRPKARAIADTVARARRRLSRACVGRALGKNAALLFVAIALFAAVRPLVWPLGEAPFWRAALRAVLLASVGLAAFAAFFAVAAWRRRPSPLAAARRLDAALGLSEVVASGYAFESTRAPIGPGESLAVERAHAALEGVDVARALAAPSARRTSAERRWLAFAALGALAGVGIGSIDHLIVERFFHPVTSKEHAAAAALARAADEAAKAQDPKAAEVVEAARRAIAAADRGDRRRAHEALEDMRRAARERDAAEREQARALRALRDEVEGGAKRGAEPRSGEEGARGEKASDALSRMMKELEAAGSKDTEAMKKLAERLAHAEAAARAASGAARARDKSGARPGSSGAPSEASSRWSRAAAALKEAREAAASGDPEAAKRALERAEREIAELEKARDAKSSEAVARIRESASRLDRSLDSGARGDRRGDRGELADSGDPDEGDGKGGGKEGDKSAAGMQSGAGQQKQPGAPGGNEGGGATEPSPGSEKRRSNVPGNLQARAEVRQGERAVGAIDGMGKGGDHRAYREIFPSYDTAVEDGLREELVPAVRRPTVRRYFSSIRPGDQEASGNTESRK